MCTNYLKKLQINNTLVLNYEIYTYKPFKYTYSYIQYTFGHSLFEYIFDKRANLLFLFTFSGENVLTITV